MAWLQTHQRSLVTAADNLLYIGFKFRLRCRVFLVVRGLTWMTTPLFFAACRPALQSRECLRWHDHMPDCQTGYEEQHDSLPRWPRNISAFVSASLDVTQPSLVSVCRAVFFFFFLMIISIGWRIGGRMIFPSCCNSSVITPGHNALVSCGL